MGITVSKELYAPSPKRGHSMEISQWYIGPGLQRAERRVSECEGRDDLPLDPAVRYSPDNGRTWTDWQTEEPIVTFEGSATYFWAGGAPYYDPTSQRHVSIWLRQTLVGGLVGEANTVYYNHCFCRLSADGKTWGTPQHLRYEAGAPFDAAQPLNPDFLQNNQSYVGNNIISLRDGTLLAPVTSVRIPADAPAPDPDGKYSHWWSPADDRNIGSACFRGLWDARREQYDWQRGQCVWVPKSVSCRGLLEAEAVELRDGRVLLLWRGSDTDVTPGRKWYSISTDGGRTLSPVQEWTYDDGTRFFSPSSYHRTIRHSATGILYWVGNICAEPPHGNSPRYPLIIAEVDEAMPALKKNTVTVIDDRQPGQSDEISFSNFPVFENRETQAIELFITPLGAKAKHSENPQDFWEADAYKYTVMVE